MQLHPQEALLQQARVLHQSEAFSEYRQRRIVVEHRLARLLQLYLAATVTNLTLVAATAGLPADTGSGSSTGRSLRTETIRSAFDFVPARLVFGQAGIVS